MKTIDNNLHSQVQKIQNRRKLRDIRKIFGKNKELKEFVNEERYFVFEGYLKKVCRKKNK